jgi:hypothetical protein
MSFFYYMLEDPCTKCSVYGCLHCLSISHCGESLLDSNDSNSELSIPLMKPVSHLLVSVTELLQEERRKLKQLSNLNDGKLAFTLSVVTIYICVGDKSPKRPHNLLTVTRNRSIQTRKRSSYDMYVCHVIGLTLDL